MSVFISYSSGSRQWAEKLDEALRESGISTWLDKENLAPGDDWQKEIRQAIESADNIIMLIDKQSKEDSVARRKSSEILYALWEAKNKRVIPVLLRNAELPKFLQGAEPEQMQIQVIKVKDLRRDWPKAVRDIADVLNSERNVADSDTGEVISWGEQARAEQRENLSYIGAVAAALKEE